MILIIVSGREMHISAILIHALVERHSTRLVAIAQVRQVSDLSVGLGSRDIAATIVSFKLNFLKSA